MNDMSEQPLYKIFYSDFKNYSSEFYKRFNSNDSIHLQIKIGEHEAFIRPTPEIYQLIISIERTNNAVNRLCFQLPEIALHQFAMRCLIDEIVLTNNIEGVHSTRKQISEILYDLSKTNNRKRFAGLVNKYSTLMNNEKIVLSKPEDIRKIYDDIFYEEIMNADSSDLPDGDIFRKSSVGVFTVTGKEIHKGLTPESEIISVMEKSLDFLNDEKYDYLLRIAVFHYLFGYIHPFYDGNGRTSRFISSYLLSQNLNSLIGYRISFTIKENIKKYYDAFKICNHYNNRGELTYFAEVFLTIVNKSMIQLKDALNEKSEKLQHYSDLLRELPCAENENILDLYFVLLQAALFSNIGLSLQELLQYANVSYNTIHARLQKIPDDLLLVNKQGRNSYYLLNLHNIDKKFFH